MASRSQVETAVQINIRRRRESVRINLILLDAINNTLYMIGLTMNKQKFQTPPAICFEQKPCSVYIWNVFIYLNKIHFFQLATDFTSQKKLQINP